MPSCPEGLGKGAREAIATRPRDPRRKDLADPCGGSRDMYALQVGAAPNHLPIMAARLLQEHRQDLSNAGLVELAFLLVQRQLQGSQTIGLHSLGNLAGGGCCGRAGALGIFEGVRLGKPDLIDKVERSLEVLIAFARKTDDEVGGECEIRASLAQALNDPPIGIGSMAPVHR